MNVILVFEYVDYDLKKYMIKFNENAINPIIVKVNISLFSFSPINFSKAYNTATKRTFSIVISNPKIYLSLKMES